MKVVRQTMQNELIEQGNCSFGSFLETTDVDQLWTSFPVMHVCATVQDKVAPMLSTPRFTTVFSLLPAVVVTGAYSVGALFPLNNPDTYGHLAQGRQIASSGFVPRHDTFSFWEGKPDAWNNYEWLSDLSLIHI